MKDPTGTITLPLETIRKMTPRQQEQYFASMEPRLAAKMKERLRDSQPVAPIESIVDQQPEGSSIANQASNVPIGIPDVSRNGGNKERLAKFTDTLSTLGGISASMIDMANMSEPESTSVGVGAAAGAVRGATAGAALGPIGMVGGALFGGIEGTIKSANQREFQEKERMRKTEGMLTGLRVAPTTVEEGGAITSDSEEIVEKPLQTELGEMILLPDGRLVDVMAKKKHKKQKGKGKEVTDIAPTPSYVFSDSKKKEIDLKDIADDILTITRGHYSEDGNEPGETVFMKDIFGEKGKVTPAALVKKVRKMLPIIEEPVEDIEKRTNEENIGRRAEFLRVVMELQEGVYKPFEIGEPLYMEWGGFTRKEPEKGGFPGFQVRPIGDFMTQFLKGQTPEERNRIFSRLQVAAAPTTAAAPVAQPGQSALPYSTDQISQYDPVIEASKSQIETGYAEDVAGVSKGGRKARMRNFGVLATSLMTAGNQNPIVTPVQKGTEFISNMFPKITESDVSNTTRRFRRRSGRAFEMLNTSGISGSKVGSAIAPILQSGFDAEANVRVKANEFNREQEGKEFGERQKVIDFNRAETTFAENATRGNRNEIIKGTGDSLTDFVSGQGELEQGIDNRLAELKKFRQENRNKITEQELGVKMRKEERDMRKKWFEEKSGQTRELIAAILKGFTKP